MPWLTAGLGVVGGLWALRRLRREPVRSRPDRATAIRLTWGLAIVAGSATALFIIPQGDIAGSGITLVAGPLIGLAIGAFVVLAGILGYALLAHPRIGSLALVGVIVCPVVLGGTVGVAMRVNQEAQWAAQRAQFEAERQETARQLAERSAVLHVSVRDVTVSTVPFHDVATGRDLTVVGTVRLTLVLRADTPLQVRTERGWAPDAWLYPGDDPARAGLYAALPILPADILAAAETPFELEFGYTADELAGQITYPPGEPGTWTLRVMLWPVNPQAPGSIRVDTPVILAAR